MSTAQGFGINKARRDILANLVTQLTGVPCTWATSPNPTIDPVSRALITLRLRSTNSASAWDKITVDQSSTATRSPGRTITQLGAQREHTIEVVVESYDPDVYAHEIYYALTTRIYRDRFRAILLTANMAVATNGDAVDLPKLVDNWSWSGCAGTLILNATDLDLISDDLDTVIESVNTTNIVPEQ